MSKYIITKKMQRPIWLTAGVAISAIVYLVIDICKIVWDVEHTEITEVEE